ncbi:ribosomal RNA methyltransferase Nop2 [Nematocida displodere]|uniref:Ribosomal RNA methyltransferase Nop2 n=1 Tax=Nematocida displodere TaxID=1805483 RepID=A0A177EJ39_9MICR|nr:ribosomal RNA methyltransferase Nop2 [Nematocida displodere]
MHGEVEEIHERIQNLERLGTAIEATYNDYLLDKITEMFSPEEKDAFIVASDKKRPATLRTNTLFDKRSTILHKLSTRGVNVEGIEWSDCGAVVYNTDVPIGATPEYLAGFYMLQSPSSMLPVMALSPQPNEKVVDMCAAPGGKTTHIAALMSNTGVLYANDVSKERVCSLAANIQRMGVTNTVCMNMDGLALPIDKADKVLLDAPCSGTGVLSKDPAAKRNKDAEIIKRIQMKQKRLILKAFDMLDSHKPETATLVYSTCSILVEENEYVVDYLLRKRPNARVVDTDLPIGREGFKSFRGLHFHPSLRLTRRFYPHVHNTDGFFVSKIRKTGLNQKEIEDRRKAQDASRKRQGLEPYQKKQKTVSNEPKTSKTSK